MTRPRLQNISPAGKHKELINSIHDRLAKLESDITELKSSIEEIRDILGGDPVEAVDPDMRIIDDDDLDPDIEE